MNPRPDDPKGVAGAKKTPLHLLPPVFLEETSHALALGAEKYGPWNWRRTKVCASTYVAATLRHLTAWWDGEEADPESGRTHLAHAAACMAILMDAGRHGALVRDTPPRDAVDESAPAAPEHLRPDANPDANPDDAGSAHPEIHWEYEDRIGVGPKEYHMIFSASRIIDGVRMFPYTYFHGRRTFIDKKTLQMIENTGQ